MANKGSNCFCIPFDCSTCYYTTVCYCSNSLTIYAGLTPGKNYYLWVRDKFQNIYNDTVTIAANGSFIITFSHFPTGLFNYSAGCYDVFLTTDSQGQNPVSMSNLYPSKIYKCIIFDILPPVFLMDDGGCNILTDDNGNYLTAD
jgi:hypothetical protein